MSQAKTKYSPSTQYMVNYITVFKLKFKKNTIGYLNFDGTNWTFSYSTWFKDQDDLKPLFEFPNKDKIYNSLELWLFFESRIPSTKQPKIKEYLASHPLDNNNKIKLLEIFGHTSINNHYKLVPNN